MFENGPDHWRIPQLKADGHKYDRGHVLVFAGGLEGVGAPRLCARAALRVGAGLVTLAVPAEALAAHAARGPDALMIRRAETLENYRTLLADMRKKAVILGPAFGIGARTCDVVKLVLAAQRKCVLDADVLTSFAQNGEVLFKAIIASGSDVVLTPHEGEFQRLFGDIVNQPRAEAASAAAKISGAIVVLKGAETMIAAPDGKIACNTDAPPDLATAGSGDVLAGLIGGLLAQGMSGFDAACAAVWLHGQAGKQAGPGLIADDLPEAILPALRRLREA